MMNDVERYLGLFENFEPFADFVSKGFLTDFLGCLTDARFREMWGINPDVTGDGEVRTTRPDIIWGEGFFEIIDWFESARRAGGTYTIITLGAGYGAQAVGAYRALQRTNPMPAKLVAVEAEPGNFEWAKRHFRDNGIDPDDHWLLNCALGDTNKPVLFPVGESGSSVNNCVATNDPRPRQIYAQQLRDPPNVADLVYNLIVDGKTGIEVVPVAGDKFRTHVEFVSVVTVNDVLSSFDSINLLKSDIQPSEIVASPPAMDIIKRKVKPVRLGTHGADTHEALPKEFVDRGFEFLFDYPPNTHHETPLGSFDINDGIITARNPDVLAARTG
jgi:hypothetical protein